MNEPIHAPMQADLPSKQQLNRATVIAAGVAALLLVTTVLPAEYGYDPTGIGSALGLTPLGVMKREALAAESVPAPAADSADLVLDDVPAPAPAAGGQTGEVTLTLAPGEGTEVKATMAAGDELRYEWRTGGARLNFELHGEESGAPASEYTSYEKGTSAGEAGTLRAPFAGTHGLFWRNRTGAPVTVTIKATGSFSRFAQVK